MMLFLYIIFSLISPDVFCRRSRTRKPSDDFTDAGQDDSGLFIWRIEDFSPVPLKKADYGKFHSSDSYIVLNSRLVDGRQARDLHYWLGNSTSQDEAGSAAVLSVMLDHILGGWAVHYRETQYEESTTFRSYFRGKLQYLPGGVKSGMNYVEEEQIMKRLFMVKGRSVVIASQVPLEVGSLNMFDCFVLDRGKGRGVFVFRPRGANSFERMKATVFATGIRDEDHAGKGSVEIFDEAENDNMSRFFDEFVPGCSMADISYVEIDDKNNDFVPKLYETRGWQDLYIDEPITQDLLDSNKTYMLVAGPINIYLWLGRFTTKMQRRTVNEVAGLYIKDNRMPSNTNIELVFEGLEATSFKQFFPSWKEIINTKSWKSVHPSEEVFSGPDTMVDKPDWDVKSLHRRTEDWLERNTNGIIGFLPKNDKEAIGRKTVWKIHNYKLVEVRDLSSFPNYKNKTLPSKSPKQKNRLLLGEGMFQGQAFLHSSNCYVILYKYGPTMKNHLGKFFLIIESFFITLTVQCITGRAR